MSRRRVRWAALRAALDAVADDFRPEDRLSTDPLGIVREHAPADYEAVSHVVAPLAYGSIQLVRRAAREVLAAIGPEPTEALRDWQPGEFLRRRPDFVYRMTRAADVDSYLAGLGRMLREFGSLEEAFRDAARDIEGDAHAQLGGYVRAMRGAMPDAERRGARYLTADPATGSAAKRWHLMLRWLCREDDGVDLGVWSVVPTEQLVLPLDTHTSRLVRWLGLSDRATVDYKMAREATDGLLRLDACDPLRYDMPLCHLGVSGECRHRFVVEVCRTCALRTCCRWTAGVRARRALGHEH